MKEKEAAQFVERKKSLSDVKKITEEHLRRELDIFEMVLKMPDEDVKEFYEWYTRHPYTKGIREVIRIVRGEGNSWEKEVAGIAVKMRGGV